MRKEVLVCDYCKREVPRFAGCDDIADMPVTLAPGIRPASVSVSWDAGDTCTTCHTVLLEESLYRITKYIEGRIEMRKGHA